MKILATIKKRLTVSYGSYASKSRFDDNSNKWVVDKMEDEKAKDTFVFCRW